MWVAGAAWRVFVVDIWFGVARGWVEIGSRLEREKEFPHRGIFFLECRYKGDQIIIIFLLL